ncbi:hypothetical protein [Herbaspirillum seropedicae]|uniref:hypothetical protein n=1 Tax=Herbaspirillum seropedicae TaxID=964 RepID=UPI003D96546C
MFEESHRIIHASPLGDVSLATPGCWWLGVGLTCKLLLPPVTYKFYVNFLSRNHSSGLNYFGKSPESAVDPLTSNEWLENANVKQLKVVQTSNIFGCPLVRAEGV